MVSLLHQLISHPAREHRAPGGLAPPETKFSRRGGSKRIPCEKKPERHHLAQESFARIPFASLPVPNCRFGNARSPGAKIESSR